MDNKYDVRISIVKLILVLFFIAFFVSSATYAYWKWTSSENKSVIFNTAVIEEYVVYDEGDSHFIGNFQPVMSFCESVNTTVSFNKTSDATDIKLYASIRMDINAIGNNISQSDDVYWIITEGNNSISCTSGFSSSSVLDYGKFKGVVAGDTIELYNFIEMETIQQSYTVWIWIDGNGKNLSNLSNNFLDTNVWTEIMMEGKYDEKTMYAVYSADDNSLRFYNTKDVITVGSVYNDLTATAVYTGFDEAVYTKNTTPWYIYAENITKVVVEDEMKPFSAMYWFSGLKNVSSVDVSKLDTFRTRNMEGLFRETGGNVSSFQIIGLENFDMSNVVSVADMFNGCGKSATTFDIGDLSGWDLSKVKKMSWMFASSGYNASVWDVGDLSNWNISNVENMNGIFNSAGYNSSVFDVGNLSGWDVFNTTSMRGTFQNSGYKATTWNVGDLSGWDVSNVITMKDMFNKSGYSASTYNIGNLNNWDTSKVTTMNYMFGESGYNASTYNIGNLSGWDVSNVTDMFYMFFKAGYKTTTFDIGNLNNWNVSNVSNMEFVFGGSGYNATTYNIGDLSGWNTQSATDMDGMFLNVGRYDTDFSMNLSGWNVSKVTSHTNFNTNVESKITSPVWVN